MARGQGDDEHTNQAHRPGAGGGHGGGIPPPPPSILP